MPYYETVKEHQVINGISRPVDVERKFYTAEEQRIGDAMWKAHVMMKGGITLPMCPDNQMDYWLKMAETARNL